MSDRGGSMAELAEERPRGRDLGHLRALARFLVSYRSAVAGALVALVVASVAVLAIGQALRRVVDMGFSADNAGLIDQYFAALLGVAAILAAATFARFYLVSWLGERVVADIRRAVYDHIMGLSPAFFEITKSGEILSRLTTDTTLIQTVVGSTASIALRNVLLLIGGSVMMVITSVKLTGYVFVVVPAVVFPIVLFGRRVRRLSRESQDRVADVSAQAGEIIGAIRTVQAFNHEDRERESFARAVERSFRVAVHRIRTRGWLTFIVILFVFGAVDFVLWVGAKDVIAGAMTAGELAAFVFYAVTVAGAFGALSEVYGDLQRASGAAERLMEILRIEPGIRTPAGPKPLPVPPAGAVSFERVTFEYPTRPGISALKDFSLDVRPGEAVALVGPSGAGKSTVFQLLLRFYDPAQGRILVDGIDLREADPRDVRTRLGLVPQDCVIFGDTAGANILYGRPDAAEDEIRDAARAAQALDFIEALPHGFDTPLGERGVTLSGGQRQRIAIARTILRDPPVLLLDEATSALDAESERLVQTALERLMAGRTTLVIAHRLATVLKADRIVVMDEGRIVAEGTHETLMAEGGLYARLAELQFNTASAAPPSGEKVAAIGA